jgi:hypothetical protein
MLPLLSLLLLDHGSTMTEPLTLRDHGPGTSGGGVSTTSGETLKSGAVRAAYRIDYTQFERLSNQDIRDQALEVGGSHAHFDALRWTMLQTLEISFGATDDLELGLTMGNYRGNDLREGHVHGNGTPGFHEWGDVTGATDPWISAKWRFSRGPEGHWAVFGGVKLPFGDDTERGEGEDAPLEPALQPGSGTFDVRLGLAYSRWITERVTLDMSAGYTHRTEEDAFKIGDLALVAAALAYRFAEDMRTFPATSVFLEAAVRQLLRNEEDGENVRNSGGTTLFVGTGLRISFSARVAWDVAVQIPVLQHLHDEQQESLFKVSTGLSFLF